MIDDLLFKVFLFSSFEPRLIKSTRFYSAEYALNISANFFNVSNVDEVGNRVHFCPPRFMHKQKAPN
jgi:hypothetical protein